MKKEYTFIDLFAGIGGFHYGLKKAGAKCVFASEIDKDARKTYEANFLKDGELSPLNFAGDITKISPQNIPDHDILCAGFPCQPFSQAGKKFGFNDTRGTLFFNVASIIKEKRPAAFFLENVRGILNHDNGKTFNVIQNTLLELGYTFHYKLIKASDFNLPQHRPRIYMVGFRSDIKDTFEFPPCLPLTKTMSWVFDGQECNKKIGFTLRVGGRGSKIVDRRNWEFYIVNNKVTRIGIKEAKRMQGYPDNFVFPVSETQAMKQLGNSVAVTAIEAVANNIIDVLKKSK